MPAKQAGIIYSIMNADLKFYESEYLNKIERDEYVNKEKQNHEGILDYIDWDKVFEEKKKKNILFLLDM